MWVDGVQRVVCGVSDVTTCQDVVIVLAHATGRTGRFTLVEKWRDNERLVAPSECPLHVLRQWGEYASDVHFILRHNSDKTSATLTDSKRAPVSQPEPASPRREDVLTSLPSRSQARGAVRRNLTFSGAHQSSAPLPPALLGNHVTRDARVAPFENFSLESVEEQSSLSSQSSSSPYSSFQHRPPFPSQHINGNTSTSQPAARFATPTHTVSPRAAPAYSQHLPRAPAPSAPVSTMTHATNSLERSRAAPRRRRQRDPTSPRAINGHAQHPLNGSRAPPPSVSMLSTSLPSNQATALLRAEKLDRLSPRVTQSHVRADPLAASASGSAVRIPNASEHRRTVAADVHLQSSQSRLVNGARNARVGDVTRTHARRPESEFYDLDDHLPSDATSHTDSVTSHSKRASSSSNRSQLSFDSTSTETDENRNRLSKHVTSHDADVSKGTKEELVKLVNLQMARLAGQEEQLRQMDAGDHTLSSLLIFCPLSSFQTVHLRQFVCKM